jgi:hypothetical protein
MIMANLLLKTGSASELEHTKELESNNVIGDINADCRSK